MNRDSQLHLDAVSEQVSWISGAYNLSSLCFPSVVGELVGAGHPTVIYLLHFDYMWISVIVSIYCREECLHTHLWI